MDIESLRYFKAHYEKRKPMFMSQESHWSWVYHVLYYLVCNVKHIDLDIAINLADEKEQINLTEH